MGSQAEAGALQATIAGEAALWNGDSPAAVSYNILVVDSAEAEKHAAEQLAIPGAELTEAGVTHTVVDMR